MGRAKSKHMIIVLNAHLKIPQEKYIEHWMFWSYNLKNLGEHITSWSCEVLGEDHMTLVMDEYLSSRQGMWMDFALSISHFCKRVGQFSSTLHWQHTWDPIPSRLTEEKYLYETSWLKLGGCCTWKWCLTQDIGSCGQPVGWRLTWDIQNTWSSPQQPFQHKLQDLTGWGLATWLAQMVNKGSRIYPHILSKT
jgi:hypothetical protein